MIGHAGAASVRPVRIVVQARMGSSRLPGKIACDIAGRTLLARVVERLSAAGPGVPGGVEVMVATSEAAGDDVTERHCRDLGVACFRGSESDVLARYVAATADLPDDAAVVRATADNPLYCPRRTAELLAIHREARADYTAVENLSYVVPEAIRAGALRAMDRLARTPRCREHVTPFFREQGGPFRVVLLPVDWQGLRPEIRLTVDTPGELARMRRLCDALCGRETLFTLEDVYGCCDADARTPGRDAVPPGGASAPAQAAAGGRPAGG